MPPNAAMPYRKKFAEIDGRRVAYIDVGTGDPIVFLHGNPTSSYLWRNIIPSVEDLGRCIAPDLIGMGDSDKLPESGPDRYRFVEHRHYLDGLLDDLGVDDAVTFVIHDWGSALGFDWGYRHQQAVKGYAYMEALVCPVTWDDWPESARRVFQGFRSPAGEEMVLEKNIFVERVLPGSTLHGITDEAMEEYRRPFREPGESRRPTLTWPREIPIDGEPAETHEIVSAYGAWIAESDVPKLLVVAEPGAILTGRQLELARSWPNQTEVTVAGNHFLQEDSPHEIGSALREWYRSL